MTAPDPVALVEPTSALSRADLPPDLLNGALRRIESDTVVIVGERRIHAENLAVMAGRVIQSLAARIAELEAERDEARRRRDAWRAKAEGFDEVRLALREKVGSPWPPQLSRALWAGIAFDQKKRADDAEAEVARLLNAFDGIAPARQARSLMSGEGGRCLRS